LYSKWARNSTIKWSKNYKKIKKPGENAGKDNGFVKLGNSRGAEWGRIGHCAELWGKEGKGKRRRKDRRVE
jgi:hypothetical protein